MVLRNIGQIFGNVSGLGLSDSFPWKHEPRDMGFQKGCHRTRGYFLSRPIRGSVVVTWFLAGVAHCDHGVPVVSPGLFNVKLLFVPFHTRLFGNKPWVLSLRGWDKEGVKFQLCGEDLSLLLRLFICLFTHSFSHLFLSPPTHVHLFCALGDNPRYLIYFTAQMFQCQPLGALSD